MSIQKVPQQPARQVPFAPLNRSNVALLTTFRRNGQGVETPVGIKLAGGNVYFTTWSTTGKVKRLACNPQVRLAPFTKWGMKVIGPTVEGTARRLDATEVEKLSTLFKAGLRSRTWDLIYRLRGWQKVHYEVSPSNA
ncbi:PPOX class F420-dependent oxidoreductase [Ktedonobacter sp. SOSP1-52]|uniref:PPOX class F420-dependent oxidoreductase n=1 Tax=Ktedonobacter sp. SOSP1-52 TaxID=2778366 RepID=UPI00191521FD|nr:PPOX class F420-dependent oxidoreductase [Ktedonobacter sp. SOSP1-52]GHO63705.1 PPOX class F420-dependent oxidoreductase [Ktedonobacter sp. SOSP1-52]